MWLKGLIFTLAMVLMLGFSLGCEPEQEDPWEEPAPPPEEPAPPPDEPAPPRDEPAPENYGPAEENNAEPRDERRF